MRRALTPEIDKWAVYLNLIEDRPEAQGHFDDMRLVQYRRTRTRDVAFAETKAETTRRLAVTLWLRACEARDAWITGSKWVTEGIVIARCRAYREFIRAEALVIRVEREQARVRRVAKVASRLAAEVAATTCSDPHAVN